MSSSDAFNRKRLSRAVVAAIAGTVMAGGAQAQLEEVIVTATKRAESMQDVPVAVSALQADSLDELRIGSFDDYVSFLPNVVSQGTGPGQNEIFIRGAATSQTTSRCLPCRVCSPPWRYTSTSNRWRCRGATWMFTPPTFRVSRCCRGRRAHSSAPARSRAPCVLSPTSRTSAACPVVSTAVSHSPRG